jgi:hypothetical protein
VPLSATLCGLPEALSAKESEALRAPVALGVKVTLTVQVLLGVTVALVQVSVLLAKSPGLVPVRVTLVMVRLAVPLLVTVTDCAALVALISWLPKLTLVGEKLIPGAVPVPLKPSVCGLSEALSANESEAVRAPVALGVKVTLTVQVLLGVTVAPVQVSALLAKSVELVPVRVTLVMVRLAVPLLVTVTDCAALLVLTS